MMEGTSTLFPRLTFAVSSIVSHRDYMMQQVLDPQEALRDRAPWAKSYSFMTVS